MTGGESFADWLAVIVASDAPENGGAGLLTLTSCAKCRECGRTFDLTNDDDAEEWAYGHDCEVMEGEPAGVANTHANATGKATQ